MSDLTNSSTLRNNNYSLAPSSGTAFDGGWRRWWHYESHRTGSDWHSVINLHLEISDRLRAAWGSL
jgi:hypothetical protein